MCVCVFVYVYTYMCMQQYIQYYTTEDVQSKYNNIHFRKRNTKPTVAECETLTKTNLNANSKVNVDILANVLVCT